MGIDLAFQRLKFLLNRHLLQFFLFRNGPFPQFKGSIALTLE